MQVARSVFGMVYRVVAVAASGNERVVAERVGGVRAARLAAEVKARGFAVRVEPTK